MRFTLPLSLILSTALHCGANHLRIGKQESAQNDAFHDALLKQLADSRNTTTLVNEQDFSLSTSSFPDLVSELATTGLQVYLNTTVPTTPTPPQACINALTANVNCNSTISLMPCVFIISYVYLTK